MRISLILIALVLVFSLGVVEAVCGDSDGGFQIYTKGAINNGTNFSVDYCLGAPYLNSSILVEHYCYGNMTNAVLSQFVECDNGCANGACIQQKTECPWDVNKDRKINVLDLIEVRNHLNKDCSQVAFSPNKESSQGIIITIVAVVLIIAIIFYNKTRTRQKRRR